MSYCTSGSRFHTWWLLYGHGQSHGNVCRCELSLVPECGLFCGARPRCKESQFYSSSFGQTTMTAFTSPRGILIILTWIFFFYDSLSVIWIPPKIPVGQVKNRTDQPDSTLHYPLACSWLRDSGEKSFSKKKCEKRAGAGERQHAATAPFPKSRASYFRFARLIRPHYTIWEPGTG